LPDQLKKFYVKKMREDRLPPLNALRAFDAVARHMSFKEAAEELFVTPAALSYQIRQLEEHLNLKLFNRLNRAIELTDHGRLIAPGLRSGFRQMAETMNQLSRRRSGNILVISAGPAFTAKWLAPRLYRYIASHPEIDTRISASLKLVDFETDDVDVAIRFGNGNYEGCDSVKLADEFVTPLCSPSLLEGPAPLRSPKDLANHTLIHDVTHVGIFELAGWRDWLKAADVKGIDTERGLRFNVADHAQDAAVAGAGVVLGRTVLAQGDIDSGRLVIPFDLKLKANFSFYVVTHKSRSNSPMIRGFLDWLQEEISGTPSDALPGPAV
jgi:LysR family transcriptional regulator, glycine cleavage system transcriptional activator